MLKIIRNVVVNFIGSFLGLLLYQKLSDILYEKYQRKTICTQCLHKKTDNELAARIRKVREEFNC